jgi:DNA-directed RNA polymerase subunit L
MSDFRNRPKGTYLFEADWQELYVLTEHWKTDLLFYKDDLKILHHLIDKYFLWISKKENLNQVKKIEESLNKIDKQCTSLLTRVSKHLHHLAELIDHPFKYDSHQFRTEHEVLEDNIADFVKDFRKSRIEVFELIEQLIESEKLVK